MISLRPGMLHCAHATFTAHVAKTAAAVQEMQDQQVNSLKAAVAQAMTEKEDTFEHLGEAREKNAELQDALREANSQLRLLEVSPF